MIRAKSRWLLSQCLSATGSALSFMCATYKPAEAFGISGRLDRLLYRSYHNALFKLTSAVSLRIHPRTAAVEQQLGRNSAPLPPPHGASLEFVVKYIVTLQYTYLVCSSQARAFVHFDTVYLETEAKYVSVEICSHYCSP